jgi:hypothetical protein
MKKLLVLILVFGLLLYFLPSSKVTAQQPKVAPQQPEEEEKLEFTGATPGVKLPTRDIEAAVVRIGNVLFYAAVLIAFIMVVWGAVVLATAAGDPGKVELARRVILYALGAIALGSIAYGLVKLVAGYVGKVEKTS